MGIITIIFHPELLESGYEVEKIYIDGYVFKRGKNYVYKTCLNSSRIKHYIDSKVLEVVEKSNTLDENMDDYDYLI